MNLNAVEFVTLAKEWLEQNGALDRSRRGGSSEPFDLVQTSADVHRLVTDETPSLAHLQAAGVLFDRLSSSRGENGFGERVETCAVLAYVGWRNSFLLGLDIESQEWLRISDQLAEEKFTAADSLSEFLLLDESRQTDGLSRSFLGTPCDVFLSLALLRAEVRRDPGRATRSAEHLFHWLLGRNAGGGQDIIGRYLLAESAWLTAAASRSVGLRSRTAEWTRIAMALFSVLTCSRPLRARVLTHKLIASFDRHRRCGFQLRAKVLESELTRCGMHHEIVLIRFASASLAKLHGDERRAQAGFESLIHDCAHSSERAVLALSQANLADMLAATDRGRAWELAKQALGDIQNLDAVSRGSLLMFVASIHLAHSESAEAIGLIRAAVHSYQCAGGGPWLAYAEVILAETLMGVGRIAEARECLVRALPIIRSEKMVDEGIHAARLLAQLEAVDFDSRNGSRAQPQGRLPS